MALVHFIVIIVCVCGSGVKITKWHSLSYLKRLLHVHMFCRHFLILCYTDSTLANGISNSLSGACFLLKVTYVYNRLANTLILMPMQFTQENM